jgi:hypothetical protein
MPSKLQQYLSLPPFRVEAPAADVAALRADDTLGSGWGTTISAVTECDLFLTLTTELSDMEASNRDGCACAEFAKDAAHRFPGHTPAFRGHSEMSELTAVFSGAASMMPRAGGSLFGVMADSEGQGLQAVNSWF